MKVLIVNNNTIYLENIINNLNGVSYEVVHFLDILSKNILEFSHIILSGGNENLDLEKFRDEVNLIKFFNGPILGICCGHQIIGKVFGMGVEDMKFYRRGEFLIKLNVENEILEGFSNEMLVYENHTHVIKDVSSDFLILADSNCGVEIFKHKNRNLYGVQFHPEVSSCGVDLFFNFLKLR